MLRSTSRLLPVFDLAVLRGAAAARSSVSVSSVGPTHPVQDTGPSTPPSSPTHFENSASTLALSDSHRNAPIEARQTVFTFIKRCLQRPRSYVSMPLATMQDLQRLEGMSTVAALSVMKPTETPKRRHGDPPARSSRAESPPLTIPSRKTTALMLAPEWRKNANAMLASFDWARMQRSAVSAVSGAATDKGIYGGSGLVLASEISRLKPNVADRIALAMGVVSPDKMQVAAAAAVSHVGSLIHDERDMQTIQAFCRNYAFGNKAGMNRIVKAMALTNPKLANELRLAQLTGQGVKQLALAVAVDDAVHAAQTRGTKGGVKSGALAEVWLMSFGATTQDPTAAQGAMLVVGELNSSVMSEVDFQRYTAGMDTTVPMGKPLSTRVKNGVMGHDDLRASVGRALGLLDKVIGTGGLRFPQLPIEANTAIEGDGRIYSKGEPLIEIRPGTMIPNGAVLHEVGHGIDFFMVQMKKDPETVRLVANVRTALGDSATIRSLKASMPEAIKIDNASGYAEKTLETYVTYLLSDDEQMARALHQWMACKSGDRAAVGELVRMVEKNPHTQHMQWPPEDFRPIAAALDAVAIHMGVVSAKPTDTE